MSDLTFYDLAVKILTEEKKALKTSDIWKIAQQKGYDKLLNSIGKSPDRSLSTILIREENKKNSLIKLVDIRPKRYALKSLFDKNQIDLDKQNDKIYEESHFDEINLHPLLAYYCFEQLNVLTKTINHVKCNRIGSGEWMHPDMVGWWFGPLKEWKKLIKDFSKSINKFPIKLYSFEIKKELNFKNIREYFFQAVSNSSWANEGYIVAYDIDEEKEFLDELTRLSQAYGIGVIKLDITDPDLSETILPAEIKEYHDWEFMNILETCLDFREFLERVNKDYTIFEVNKNGYDKIHERDYLIDIFKK